MAKSTDKGYWTGSSSLCQANCGIVVHPRNPRDRAFPNPIPNPPNKGHLLGHLYEGRYQYLLYCYKVIINEVFLAESDYNVLYYLTFPLVIFARCLFSWQTFNGWVQTRFEICWLMHFRDSVKALSVEFFAVICYLPLLRWLRLRAMLG